MPKSEKEPCPTAELRETRLWLLKNSPKSGSADGKVFVYQFPVPARGWPSALHDLHSPMDFGLLRFALLSASLSGLFVYDAYVEVLFILCTSV